MTHSSCNRSSIALEDGGQGQHEARVLVARRRIGNEVAVPPDFDQKLEGIIGILKAGESLDEMTKYDSDNAGRFLSVSSTWERLVSELIFQFERVPDHCGRYRDSLLAVLEILASNGDPIDCWRRVRESILGNIDALSGWDRRGHHSPFGEVVRRGDHYYTNRDGEEIEVIGARTSTETRWDFIFDDVKRDHGLLKSILRVVALRNACVDFRKNPAGYPETIRLRLSEDQNGQTWFLHWQWEIPWPYERRYLPWTPECSQCNVDYLADDLLAWFADREHLPGRDTLTLTLSDDVREFEEKTKDFPWQHEIALDTDLIFGDTPEVWFEFRGHPIRWINRTPHMLATLVIPAPELQNAGPIYKLALEFMSALVFKEGHHHIRTVASCGSGRRRLPLLRQPNQLGGLKLPTLPELPSDYASGSRKALAIALFAEGVNSGSVYYSFLSYYKVIESAHGGVKDSVINWINANLNEIRPYPRPERIAELQQKEDNVGEYLYVANRCAVAHASSEPVADPDNPEDRQRLTSNLPVVQALARKAIEDGLFDEQPEADCAEQ